MSVAPRVGTEVDLVDVRELAGQALHERVATEGDHRRLVRLTPLGQRLAQVGQRLAVAGGAHAVGHVDHEDGGQPVDRQLEMQARQRQHE